jgi:hypothetical protein
LECLADCGGGEVEILLLDVTGLALERYVALGTVDEDLAGDDTHGDSGREDVQESGLTSTRYTLTVSPDAVT